MKSIKEQMNKYCHVDYNEFENPIIEKLSRDIIKFSINKRNKIWYAGNSGSEALEAAMKLSYSVHLANNKKRKLNLSIDPNPSWCIITSIVNINV